MTRSLSRQLKDDSARRIAIGKFRAVPVTDLLEFHATWGQAPMNLPNVVRKRWGVSMATYWQRIMEVIDLPEALEAAYPEMVRVLRKRRDAERAFQRVALQRRIPVGHPDHGRRGD